jgi:threonylcarbamoyladenosine tRNA methylthiotransferase MtaB
VNLSNSKTNSNKIAFHTLGCKLNFAETSMIARKFTEKGYQKVNFTSDADIFIINTCSVTQVADKKCRQVINKAARKGAKVVVMGCYSQLKPEFLAAIKGVDLVLGTKEKFHVIEHVENLLNKSQKGIFAGRVYDLNTFDPSFSFSERTRAFLKIQDGCDYKCSYCTVPLARGISRNQSIADTVKNAMIIAEKGIQEIVLTGVNIGDFGKSTGENFIKLIHDLDKIEGIERFRISSIEPNLLDDEIIEFISNSEKFVHHFHIPLQSGCDKTLAAMGRRYRRDLFASRVNKIKSMMPFACIGADVIVGFPDENDNDFNDTKRFVESLDISYLHVFPFSERPGTKAASMERKVRNTIIEQRHRILTLVSDSKRKKFYEFNLGRHEKVIFESKLKGGFISGFTSNYIKVEAPFQSNLIGKVVDVSLESIGETGNFKVLIKKN